MLSIVMLINRTGSMVLPFLGVYMADHLQFDIATIGLVLSCFGVGGMVGSWLGGYLTDKLGEYYVQLGSLLISVPLFLIYPFFTTPVSLGLLVLVQSIVSELFRPANSVAISKYARPENLTRAFSLNRMAVNLGFSIGPAMGGFLSIYSYNLLFYTNGIMTLGAAIVYYNFFKKRQRLFKIQKQRKRRDEIAKVEPFRKELSPYSDLPFLLFCMICLVFNICFFQLMNTLPLFYKEGLHLSQGMIGLLMGTNGIVVVVFEMLLVHVAEKKLTVAQTMLFGTLVCALSFALLGFNPAHVTLFLAMSLLSIGEILVLPFMASITAKRSGIHNKGAYMGANGLSFALAFIVAPILGTKLVISIGFSNLWISTTLALIVCSFMFYYFSPILSRPKKLRS